MRRVWRHSGASESERRQSRHCTCSVNGGSKSRLAGSAIALRRWQVLGVKQTPCARHLRHLLHLRGLLLQLFRCPALHLLHFFGPAVHQAAALALPEARRHAAAAVRFLSLFALPVSRYTAEPALPTATGLSRPQQPEQAHAPVLACLVRHCAPFPGTQAPPAASVRRQRGQRKDCQPAGIAPRVQQAGWSIHTAPPRASTDGTGTPRARRRPTAQNNSDSRTAALATKGLPPAVSSRSS